MYYWGLDVSRKSTHVCIENERGRRMTQAVVLPDAGGAHGGA